MISPLRGMPQLIYVSLEIVLRIHILDYQRSLNCPSCYSQLHAETIAYLQKDLSIYRTLRKDIEAQGLLVGGV